MKESLELHVDAGFKLFCWIFAVTLVVAKERLEPHGDAGFGVICLRIVVMNLVAVKECLELHSNAGFGLFCFRIVAVNLVAVKGRLKPHGDAGFGSFCYRIVVANLVAVKERLEPHCHAGVCFFRFRILAVNLGLVKERLGPHGDATFGFFCGQIFAENLVAVKERPEPHGDASLCFFGSRTFAVTLVAAKERLESEQAAAQPRVHRPGSCGLQARRSSSWLVPGPTAPTRSRVSTGRTPAELTGGDRGAGSTGFLQPRRAAADAPAGTLQPRQEEIQQPAKTGPCSPDAQSRGRRPALYSLVRKRSSSWQCRNLAASTRTRVSTGRDPAVSTGGDRAAGNAGILRPQPSHSAVEYNPGVGFKVACFSERRHTPWPWPYDAMAYNPDVGVNVAWLSVKGRTSWQCTTKTEIIVVFVNSSWGRGVLGELDESPDGDRDIRPEAARKKLPASTRPSVERLTAGVERGHDCHGRARGGGCLDIFVGKAAHTDSDIGWRRDSEGSAVLYVVTVV